MSKYKKEFGCMAEAIITNAIVMPAIKTKEGDPLPKYHYTENAAWDTGAQFTVISPRIVDILQLEPIHKSEIMGIGGDQTVLTYLIHIGLPSGDLIHDVEVYCSDIDDYDLLIGMDIITLTDFYITNKDNKTIFSYKIPSDGESNF